MTDSDPNELAMRNYETLHGHFGRQQREDLLAAARSEEYVARTNRDPIGHHSALGVDHRTRANRSAVASCLREYFGGTLERGRMNKPVERSESHTGAELADRMTSRLEVANALVSLHREHLNLWLAVVRQYRDNLTRAQIAERWHKSRQTVSYEIDAGLDVLIERLYLDVLA